MVSENFTIPKTLSPEDIIISNVYHDSFQLTLPRGNQFVKGVIVKLEDFLANIGERNSSAPVLRSSTFLYPENTEGPLVTFTVSGLSPGRLYSVRVQQTTQVRNIWRYPIFHPAKSCSRWGRGPPSPLRTTPNCGLLLSPLRGQ